MKFSIAESRMHVLTVSLGGLNTALSTGFQLLVIYRLRVGELSDLYYGATIVTGVVFTMFLDPLSNVLIPMFVEKSASKSDEKVELLWNSLLVVFLGGLLILFAVYFPVRLSFPFVFKSLRWVSPGEVGKIVIAYSLYLVLFGLIVVKNCYLFASGKPAAAQSNLLIGWTVSVFLLWKVDITVDVSRIAYCLIAGNAVGLVLPNLGRRVLTYRGKHFRDHLGSLISRGAFLTSGSVVFEAESLLDGAISSFSGVGGLTVYQLFSRMLVSIATIINSGYIQPITKDFAESARQEHWADLRARAARGALWSSAASLACLAPLLPIFLFLRARPIHALDVYVRVLEGNYRVLLLMLGLLVGCAVWKVYATGLIVLRRERRFAVICVAGFVLGAIFKVAGALVAGLAGLALGTSLYWIFGAAGMAAGFRKSLREEQNSPRTAPAELSPQILSKVGSTD